MNADRLIAITENKYNALKAELKKNGYKLITIDIDNFVYYFSNEKEIIAVGTF